MTDKMETNTKKTKQDRVTELTHDNSHLYFLLGSLSDAYNQMNDVAKREFMNALEKKLIAAKESEPELAETLETFMDAMERN